MYRRLVLLRVLLLIFVAAAVAYAEYYPARFEEGYTYTVREAFLYSEPSDSAETVAIIPPGDFIQITGFTEETFMKDSCSWGWYAASYRLENEEYQGFVQDSDLAFASLSIGMDTLFVFSLTEFNTIDNAFEGEISVIFQGEVLLTKDYRPNWTPYGRMFDYDVAASPLNPQNLTGVKKLIVFYSGLDISGVQCREDLFLWTDDGRLIEGPQAVSVFEDEESRLTTEFILPSTPGGERDRISLRARTETFDPVTETWHLTEEQTSSFLWTGSGFEEQ